jgi:hypothetical protein
MIVNESCNKLVDYGFILRYVSTVLSLLYLYISNNKFTKKYIYLILVILLCVLDNFDTLIIKIHSELYKNIGHLDCAYHFHYQTNDKICDSLSYVLTFILLCFYFKPDFILLFFIIYRIIGVMIFCITKDSSWLILFFDFIKEYLLYLFIFNRNYSYIFVFIIIKISFEIYWHKIRNNIDYKLDK